MMHWFLPCAFQWRVTAPLRFGKRYLVRVRRIFTDFFFGTDAEAERVRDPIMDTVVEYTEEALWFIKTVMLFGAVSGFVISVPCLNYLWFFWVESAKCNRPLRYWLVLNCSLQLIQVPVRLIFFSRLRYVEMNGGRNNRALIYRYLRLMTSSRAWKCSRFLSIINYFWFIMGVIWVLNSSQCSEPPGMWKLTVSVIAVSMARLLITLVCFYHSFPPQGGHNNPAPKRRGAPLSIIEAIPKLTFSAENAEKIRDPLCSICLADWVDEDEVRLLHCNHVFHKRCVDVWLLRNGLCPLCKIAVTERPDTLSS